MNIFKIPQKRDAEIPPRLNKAEDVELFILNHEFVSERSINNSRLHMLLYFTQAFFIEEQHRLCFGEEFRAYVYPVLLSSYRRYKGYGDLNLFPSLFEVSDVNQALDRVSATDQELIVQCLEESAEYNTQELIRISRNQSPFYTAEANYQTNKLPQKDDSRPAYRNSETEKYNDSLCIIKNDILMSYFME